MINLITGVPGSGKTCYSLEFMQKQTKEGRPLFVHGIPELKIPHIDTYCSSPNCDVCTEFTEEDKANMYPAEDWHEWAPQGAVLFYDEVQNVYRPRSSSSKPPASIQAFEVHRHRGLDFYLISQSPKLFDGNIRELISRHIHLKANWSGRYQYEWPECKTSVQSTSDAIRSPYKLNPKMFALYKSASMHTKQKRTVPFAVYIFIFFVIVALFLASRVYARIAGAVTDDVPVDEVSLSAGELGSSFIPIPSREVKQAEYLDFNPVIKGVLESAPAYSTLLKVKAFPTVHACIAGKGKCTCYTKQMTIYPTTLQRCLSHINRDVDAFNPFYEPVKKQYSKQVEKVIG